MSNQLIAVQSDDIQTIQVLDPNGKIVSSELEPKLSDEQLRELMKRMVFTRVWEP